MSVEIIPVGSGAGNHKTSLVLRLDVTGKTYTGHNRSENIMMTHNNAGTPYQYTVALDSGGAQTAFTTGAAAGGVVIELPRGNTTPVYFSTVSGGSWINIRTDGMTVLPLSGASTFYMKQDAATSVNVVWRWI